MTMKTEKGKLTEKKICQKRSVLFHWQSSKQCSVSVDHKASVSGYPHRDTNKVTSKLQYQVSPNVRLDQNSAYHCATSVQ